MTVEMPSIDTRESSHRHLPSGSDTSNGIGNGSAAPAVDGAAAQVLGRVRVHVRAFLEVMQEDDDTDPTYPTLDVAGDPSPLGDLARVLRLSRTEHAMLWLLVAHELCPRTRLMVRQQNTEQLADPTADAVRRLVSGMTPSLRIWGELGEEAPLRRHVLVERTDGGTDTPEHRQTLKASRRTISLALGARDIDPEIKTHARIVDPRPLEELVYDGVPVHDLEQAMLNGNGIVIACGRDGIGKRSMLAAIAGKLGHRVLAFDARQLPRQEIAARRQLRVLLRESMLAGAIPLVENVDALEDAGNESPRWEAFVEELSGLVLATSTSRVMRRSATPALWCEFPPPPASRLAELWQEGIPEAHPDDIELLASLYPLAPALIVAASRSAHDRAFGSPLSQEHIESGIQSAVDGRLAGLAQRITTSQTWDDLVLPEDQAIAVEELVARIRHRNRVYSEWGFARKVGKGLGLVSLFSGPPGTGKTMCAALIAKTLGVPMYQVDISKLASKWIGETEKNLANLFDAAESAHAMLLFDEADSVFGKRTDVKSSNDRHANQETNYVLQRIESFSGLCVLTTNHEGAIDEAFRRRIAVHVRLSVPEEAERERLWNVMLPAEASVGGDVHFEKLARNFEMSGGHIRNAVLRAAFLAANEGCAISMRHLDRSARLEYEASGKLATTF